MLLTRSPLYSLPEGSFLVRLACVRRAASVDSEPGSNSRVKVVAPIRPKPYRNELVSVGRPAELGMTSLRFFASNQTVKNRRRFGSSAFASPQRQNSIRPRAILNSSRLERAGPSSESCCGKQLRVRSNPFRVLLLPVSAPLRFALESGFEAAKSPVPQRHFSNFSNPAGALQLRREVFFAAVLCRNQQPNQAASSQPP